MAYGLLYKSAFGAMIAVNKPPAADEEVDIVCTETILAKPEICQLIVFNMYDHLKIKLQGHIEELLKQKLNK